MNKRSGFLSMIAATVIWGNFVILFHHIRYVPVLDVLAHRVFWGLVVLLLWLAFQGRLGELRRNLQSPKILATLLFAALFILANWGLFVWSTGHGHALQAGLGYFIYPLVSIAFGAIFNREKLDHLQLLSVGVAGLGVLVLTFGLGEIPWISLLIALSFAGYGLIKSRVQIGAVMSVAIENILLLPPTLIWLLFFAQYGLTFGHSLDAGFWLVIAGMLTALALIGFSHATKTIGMVATGMLFFINPTLQVLNAAFILGEPLTLWHKIAFPLIWLACAIYCYDLWKRGRVKMRLAPV